MKILLINHFPLEGSGSGVYTRNLAIELTKRGNEVRVIFPENEKPREEIFEQRPIYFKGLNSTDWDLDYDFPCFTSHPRSMNTYYDLNDEQMKNYIDIFLKRVKEEVDDFNPDIIHAQHLWIAPFAASKTKVPYVVTAHGTDLKGFKKDSRYHKYALEGARNASKIITISKQVDSEVKSLYGVNDEDTEIVMNGYDEELFKPMNLDRKKILNNFGVNTSPDYIVSFAGKLTHFKGVDVLVKAAKTYNNSIEGKTVATLIAGNGELYSELVELKDRLSIKNLFFLGHVSQKKLVDLYNIADVSTVPSRVEPFGLVAIEALGCGTPVVVTNQGGLVDFINDDVGTLIDVDDDMELASAIKNELTRNDKEERSKRCYKYAKENFSWKNTLDNLEKIYGGVKK
ncbi:glycosyltransferase family 4 protein [Senegalia massiliensis]|uniref:glycosyltransferase family 4 protein n=1 Tax=Senegalia massiliensis TaxID=1720316 RepID=UPI0013EF10F9|nr:glycosyltransferase family 4 protein [Senegalia massiliensis]